MTKFSGFQEHDFSVTVRGTHWRHRGALGGEIRKRLRRLYGQRYQTWGLPGSNVMHIARRAEYTFPPTGPQVCLFISAAPAHLRWGMLLPTDAKHWQRFLLRLQQDAGVLPLLLYLLNTYQLTLTDTADAAGGALGGCWGYEQGELIWREACSLPRTALPHDILYRLAEFPADSAHQLTLYTQTDAKSAIGWEGEAVERLMPALAALIPLYELCVAAC